MSDGGVVFIGICILIATPFYLYSLASVVCRAYFKEKMMHHKALLRELSEGD